MTALGRDRKAPQAGSPNEPVPPLLSLPVAAGAKLYEGAIVCTNASGYAVRGSADTTLTVQGIVAKQADNSAAGAADGDINVLVRRGSFAIGQTGTTIDRSSLKTPVYVVDDQTVSLDDGGATRPLAGVVESVLTDGTIFVLFGVLIMPDTADASLATPSANGLMSSAYASAIHASVADMTALKAIAAGARANGMLVAVLAGTGGGVEMWRFNSTSAASDATESLVATPAAGSGRWLYAASTCALTIPVTKDNTDNQTIFTVPAGSRLKVREAWWEVSVSWTGGTTPAIGVHASPTGWTTKGDILGGASGDLTATLVSTDTRMTGTVGAKLDTYAHGRLIMIAADTFKFDRIADAFTAGAANVRVLCDVLKNVGA